MNSDNLVIIIPLAIIALLWAVGKVKRVIRAKQIKKRAVTLGYEYKESGNGHTWLNKDAGNLRKSFNNIVVADNATIPFVVYDYYYRTRRRSNIRLTKAQFRTDTLHLPDFKLRPTDWKDKVNAAMGLKDINFDNAPEFSKSYFLRAADEEKYVRFLLLH